MQCAFMVTPSGLSHCPKYAIMGLLERRRDVAETHVGGYSMNREEILRILASFRERKQDEFGILRLGVFGSVARDQATEASDVDVVVELGQPDLLALVGVKQELEELLRLPTDVVRYREEMNPYLKRRIEQEAIYV